MWLPGDFWFSLILSCHIGDGGERREGVGFVLIKDSEEIAAKCGPAKRARLVFDFL